MFISREVSTAKRNDDSAPRTKKQRLTPPHLPRMSHACLGHPYTVFQAKDNTVEQSEKKKERGCFSPLALEISAHCIGKQELVEGSGTRVPSTDCYPFGWEPRRIGKDDAQPGWRPGLRLTSASPYVGLGIVPSLLLHVRIHAGARVKVPEWLIERKPAFRLRLISDPDDNWEGVRPVSRNRGGKCSSQIPSATESTCFGGKGNKHLGCSRESVLQLFSCGRAQAFSARICPRDMTRAESFPPLGPLSWAFSLVL